MNLEFVHTIEFSAFLILFLASMLFATAMWVMHDLDKDDEKNIKHRNKKLKKA